jgi:hypothetical protein
MGTGIIISIQVDNLLKETAEIETGIAEKSRAGIFKKPMGLGTEEE